MYADQLPLSITLRDDAYFDNFFVGKNAQLIDALKKNFTDKKEQFIYCYGKPGVGRTHLLQACCHRATEINKSIFYLPLAHYDDFSPSILESLEQHDYVCIDDINCIVGNRAWEEALFHFYNRARDQGVSLLVSAQQPPQQLACLLPDLQSRLSWGLALEIKDLADDEKKQALQMRAALRGLVLSEEVTHYLLHRYARNMRDLFYVLETLDHASLIAKRKITIPFIRSVMNHD